MGYKKSKQNLNTKLILYLVSTILIVVILIGASINLVFNKKFEEYIIKNNEKSISQLVDLIEKELNNKNASLSNISKLGIDAIDEGIFMELYDENGDLIWGAMEYNSSLCHQVMGNIKSNMNHAMPRWDEDYTENTYEIKSSNNESIGYMVVGSYGSLYYMDNDVDFLQEINKVILGVGILMVLITTTIAIIIAKKISKPIETVSNMTNLMKEGGYNHKLDYESNIAEIDILIKSINDLAYKLDEQENLRKRLTTDISHELRTPLTSIQTHLEAMIDGIWEPSIGRLNSVNEEVIRLTDLVNQLKNLAEFDKERNKLNISPVNLKDLITNIIYNQQGSALEKNISVNFDLENIDAYLDRDKISQVIVNLLSNAIRYTNENGQVDISANEENENIKICVRDNGIGIPEDSLNYIFERFYRVDESRSKDKGGIGVGLTIVKSIVDLHKGKIGVESKEGEGSTFIITLPKEVE